MAGEMTAATLNTVHNLYFYLDTMRRIREAIVFGTFEKLRQEFHQTFSRRPQQTDMSDDRLVDRHVVFAAAGTRTVLLQFLPFAMILAIFYFLILLPMKRRQKKIQEFQDSLKVGDKIVTTGGIYGQITRVTDKIRAARRSPTRCASRWRARPSAATRARTGRPRSRGNA